MAATAATTVVNSFFKDWKKIDSSYIRPELYSLRKPLNTILFTVAALAAYPQIIGQDKINCMPHINCTESLNTPCSQRADGYTITDLPYNQKLYIDDACRRTHMSKYRFYLLYILVAVSAVSVIIQRLWRIIPDNNSFVRQFLKVVADSENDVGLERLLTKIHMPKKDDSRLTESQVEENIQLIEHILNFDDDLDIDHRHKLIGLIDRAKELKVGQDSQSVSLNIMSVVSTAIHFILTLAFIISSNSVDGLVFYEEFLCQHENFGRDTTNTMLCVDLQATFLTVIRFTFNVILFIISITRVIMEIRIQILVHGKYHGNVQKILRYKLYDVKHSKRKHRNLLFLLVHLKLYDQGLFNAVSLLMSEQMNEVRRRQKRDKLVRHLQDVVRSGKLGAVRQFIRQLRMMHVHDPDGALDDIVAHHGTVEVNLSREQHQQFRDCVNAVIQADDGQRQAALHRSVESGQPEVVEHLIHAGADVDIRDVNSETPLHKAMRHGFAEVVEVLLRQKADVKATNKEGKTPVEMVVDKNKLWDMLCIAIKAGNDLDLIQHLIQSGADLSLDRPEVGSLLHVAVHKNSSRICRLLIDQGASLEVRDGRQRTPLQAAVTGASVKVVKMLVEAGADVGVTVTEKGRALTLLDLAQDNDRPTVKEYVQKINRERFMTSLGTSSSGTV